MTRKHYFLYVLNKIIPEIGDGKVQILSYENISSVPQDSRKSSDPVLGTVIFIKGCTAKEKIALPKGHSVEVKTINNARKFLERLGILPSECKEVAAFVFSQDPAALFHRGKNTIYCLFDLEELVLRISRLEDEFGLEDRHGRFLSIYHTNESRWQIPMLDIIGKLIRDTFSLPAFKKNYGVIMTHDIDRVVVDPTLVIKNIILKKKIERFTFHGGNDTLFQSLMALIDINSQYSVESTWFFLSGNYSLRRYGNRYSINSGKVKKLIAAIACNRQFIGLHTSFYGAFDFQQTLKEKTILEDTSGRPVYLNRNHYLRFNIKKSITIYEQCGFRADASMGYTDANGFRAGLCQPFRPWNYESGRISTILEIPLLYMDSAKSGNLADSWNDLQRIFHWVKKLRGCGTILFHPCFMASSRENQDFYLSVIKECRRFNVPIISFDDVLAWESGDISYGN